MNRREALRQMGAGFGTVGLASMMQAAEVIGPLAPKAPHFAPKAKHVIYLFLNGGMSHIDTFDHKPELQKRDGQALSGADPKTGFFTAASTSARSFIFRREPLSVFAR